MSTLPQAQLLPTEMADAAPDITLTFKAHYGFVWRVLLHHGVPTADLEDALQEVFLVVHRRLPEYREQDKIRAWLYAIALRVARDHRKRAHRRREQLAERLPEDMQPPSQANDVAKQQALQLAERLLRALPDKQRDVFMLYEVEQLSMPEVALAVGCPLATAHARLRLARARVLVLLARARLRGDVP